jgi:alpha-glucosidase (family GH31 glycosyl hydrolase)
MLFEDNGFVGPRRSGDRIDGYLFCYNFDYKRAMKSFFAISGRQPLLPRWALGNWWSRYEKYTDKGYLELMDKFESEAVPLSVAVVDMDWHVTEGDDVETSGWTGYTWEKKYFPDPQGFADALHKRKLKITLNDHPHQGIHHHEEPYEAVAKELGHDTSTKAPILFNPTSQKFMYAYLNTLHRILEKQTDFWWIDWQQGPNSAIPGVDPLWLLNHFHFLDHEQQQGLHKALIFSRFAGPGSHRYPVGFSGDSIMTWESLEFQPEFTATASNIGFGWWSNDIGGHMGGYRDDELAARWVQLGVFSPIMRLHSSNSRWASKEPWLYRQESYLSMTRFLRLRHRLLPYLHTMNAASALDDEPIMQPLYWKYPERDEAYGKPNQYYFGANLIVAPVVKPRDKRTNVAAVDVWVPPGKHVDIMNGMIYDGDREVAMHRGIDYLPVLAPEGAIIPLDKESSPANGCENPTGYEILVVVGKDGQFTIREDTQDDKDVTEKTSGIREIELAWDQAKGQLRFNSTGKEWKIRFISFNTVPQPLALSINGFTIPDFKATVDSGVDSPGLVIELPPLGDDNTPVVVDLGPDPQLAPVEKAPRFQRLILDAQMDMNMKDRVWAAVASDRPVHVKLGQLMSLGLDEALIAPLIEILVAHSA